MSDFSLSDYLLAYMVAYGPWMFGLALLLGALGVPVPGTLLVLAAGAFVRQGIFDGATVGALGLLGVVLGDSLGYGLGRYARLWVERRMGGLAAWRTAEGHFQQWGGAAIYLTRFLLTPLAVPTNLIAGGSTYPFWRFFGYDALGEATWLLVYGGLGYFFGSQWEALSELISNFSGLLAGIVLLAGGLYLWTQRLRRRSQRLAWAAQGSQPASPRPEKGGADSA
ncbi:DedA family protein [Litorilinea aerophila]|uniref:DedA family protein n=1 Tax=Litorilinea aerophila TaxID=1204385 RepID=A0A540VDC1_9CHLR|nr:DedA family protein [Litorilinea aerophila]MCC9077459.1 DedA family protein [Litorilinea aerophila]